MNVIGTIAPVLVPMVSRGAVLGDATIFDPDIVLGLSRSNPCLGMRHHSPLFTVLGGVGIVPISGSARLGFIGRTSRVPLGMRKFDIRAVGSEAGFLLLLLM